VKFCVIRKVPFKLPGNKPRIVWGNVVCESGGLALVLVPKMNSHGSHTIFIAQENLTERLFEAVTPHCFSLESGDLTDAGNKLKMLGKSLEHDDFIRHFSTDDFP